MRIPLGPITLSIKGGNRTEGAVAAVFWVVVPTYMVWLID